MVVTYGEKNANRCCRVLTKQEFKRNYIMFTFTETDVFAFNIFFPSSLVCFRFRRQVVSFYSPSLFRSLQREQQQRATAPVQSEEGKGALINSFCFVVFF